VAPKLALIPSPKELWLSERSSRVRTYFEKSHNPYYVNGLNGTVTVTMGDEDYGVLAEVPFHRLPSKK